MIQKAQAGASHCPRARPGSGRVTISVAVGCAIGAGADGVVRAGRGGLGCRIPVGAVYTHGPAFATSALPSLRLASVEAGKEGRCSPLRAASMGRLESAFDSLPTVVRTAWT
jgi:hypothetical protein